MQNGASSTHCTRVARFPRMMQTDACEKNYARILWQVACQGTLSSSQRTFQRSTRGALLIVARMEGGNSKYICAADTMHAAPYCLTHGQPAATAFAVEVELWYRTKALNQLYVRVS